MSDQKKPKKHEKDNQYLEEFGTLDLGLQTPTLPRIKSKAAISVTNSQTEEDDLAFAKGCMWAMALSIPMWALIIAAVKWLFI